MNQNIKILYDQAEIVPGDLGPRYALADEFAKQFAQLIINKCADIADDEAPNPAGCGWITRTAGQRIREYFGVEL
jgi:hypothetical protein